MIVSNMTVAQFLHQYYKQDRYTGRGADYAKTLLQSHTQDFEHDGYDVISHHDSSNGQVMVLDGLQKPLPGFLQEPECKHLHTTVEQEGGWRFDGEPYDDIREIVRCLDCHDDITPVEPETELPY